MPGCFGLEKGKDDVVFMEFGDVSSYVNGACHAMALGLGYGSIVILIGYVFFSIFEMFEKGGAPDA